MESTISKLEEEKKDGEWSSYLPKSIKHRLQALFSFESKRATVLNHIRIGLRLRSLGQENITELEKTGHPKNTNVKGNLEKGLGGNWGWVGP